MAKKALTAASRRNRHTAETILGLIDSLPQEERKGVFELLAGRRDNRPVNELLKLLLEALGFFDMLWTSTEELWGGQEAASAVRPQLDGEEANKMFNDLKRKVANLQVKRGMTPANRETLDHFYELLKKYGRQRGGQMKALRELVTLPSEQAKPYVLQYQESSRYSPHGDGDIEAVRQHVKRLRTTDGRRKQ